MKATRNPSRHWRRGALLAATTVLARAAPPAAVPSDMAATDSDSLLWAGGFVALVLVVILALGVRWLHARQRLRATREQALRRANAELSVRLERLEGERAVAASHSSAERERGLQAERDQARAALARARRSLQAQRALFGNGPVRRLVFEPEPPYRLRYAVPPWPTVAAGGADVLHERVAPDGRAALRDGVAQALGEPGRPVACSLPIATATGPVPHRLHLLVADAADEPRRLVEAYLLPLLHHPEAADEVRDAEERHDELHSLVRSMSAGQRFMESLQQLTEMLQQCHTREQGLEIVARAGAALFPHWDGAIGVTEPDGNERIATRWGEFFAVERGAAANCWAARRNRVHVAVGGAAAGNGHRPQPVCSHFGHGNQLPPGMTHAICAPLMASGAPPLLLHLVTHASLDADTLATVSWSAESLSHALELALANLDLRASLREQAVRDAMTGLYNRRHFDEVLALETSRAVRADGGLVLALLDIDHFKSFNDSFGHEAGDVVLRAVAQELLGFVRSYDTACRVGGEELTVLLPNARLEESCARLEQLRARIGELRLEHDGQPLGTVAVSVGVADLAGGPPETLLRRADLALYAAKRGGRDRLVPWRRELGEPSGFTPLA